jgi:protein transport protein SEC31
MGLLAGGMENGAVHVWNPRGVMAQQPSVVASYSKHASGPVKALQFSSLNPTQLASGGSDGQVLIANFENPDAPTIFQPSDDYRQAAQITQVAWNTQVAHIVASSAGDGTVAVWDLKSQKKWCELRDSAGQAVSDVAWNPTQGLHMLTASADDRNPVLKLWDLRASTSMPLATLAGHQQGILSVAWCPHDDHLMLS